MAGKAQQLGRTSFFAYLSSRPDAIILGTQRQTWALLSSVSAQAFQEVSDLLLNGCGWGF